MIFYPDVNLVHLNYKYLMSFPVLLKKHMYLGGIHAEIKIIRGSVVHDTYK